MSVRLTFAPDASILLSSGARRLAAAAAVTLGPHGRAVLASDESGQTIALGADLLRQGHITLADARCNLGGQLLVEAARHMRSAEGDGSATCAVLAMRILESAMKRAAAGDDPVNLKRGMHDACDAMAAELARMAWRALPCELVRIAALAAGSNALGEQVAQALASAGDDGEILVEDSHGTELQTELQPAAAMRLAGSYAAHAFLTSEATSTSVLDDPLVLIAGQTISTMEDILPALEHLVQMTRCFVLVGNAVDGEALSTLVVNKLRGTFDCLAINVAPRDAGRLHALSQLTGATLFGTETGRSLRSARPADFGSARSVKSTGRETLFTAHADRLASGVLHTAEAFRPVVRIKVGGATQAEQRWRKSCIQSALASARASMQEGCIPGGGVALIRAAQAVEIRMRAGPGAAGAQVLLDAAAAPLRSIAANAGCDPAWIAAEVGRQGADIGWDASTGQFGSMRAFGILDSVRVVRAALCTAVSLAAVTFDAAALVTRGS